MQHRSLQRRLDALEARHTPPDDSAEQAIAAEQFWAKLDDLIERNRDTELSPNMSHVERIAWLASRDPEQAAQQLLEAARESKRKSDAYDPRRRIWHVGGR